MFVFPSCWDFFVLSCCLLGIGRLRVRILPFLVFVCVCVCVFFFSVLLFGLFCFGLCLLECFWCFLGGDLAIPKTAKIRNAQKGHFE